MVYLYVKVLYTLSVRCYIFPVMLGITVSLYDNPLSLVTNGR